MGEDIGFDPSAVYDRELLLFGARRSAVLDVREVHRYGADSFGDADYVSVYGMRPAEWDARGIRLLGRTAVECTGDRLAEAIAVDVAAVARSAPCTPDPLVIDAFLGSGNTLYWIQRCLPGSTAIGFEVDAELCQITRQNLAVLESRLEIVNIDYAAGLAKVAAPADRLVIVFVAPPWGDALDPRLGLDLRRTTPPVTQILDVLIQRFPDQPLLFAVQVHERLDLASLAELTPRCAWWAMHVYDLNQPGHNHGIVLGSRGWVPPGTPLDPAPAAS